MKIPTAQTTKPLPSAVDDLKQQCGALAPRVVLYFASVKYDAAELARQMKQAFPAGCVCGCTTAGEINGPSMTSGSIVAMFLGEDVVEDAAAATVENLSAGISLDSAMAHLEHHFGESPASMSIDRYVGLVMVDGLSGAEERLLERIGDRTDLHFVGGSAGDDLHFERTWVMEGGNAHTDAAVLVLLRLKRPFEIVKAQSFRPTGRTLVSTKVDEATRTVLEFDHKPALQAYAEALQIPVEAVAEGFFRHPLGLMIDGEPFVRSPQRVDGDTIRFYCQIRPDTELAVLEATDLLADTRRAVESAAAGGEIRGIIDFQCILRTLQLREERKCSQYGAIFGDIPAIGFSTYGEAYIGHLNQTSTMLVLH